MHKKVIALILCLFASMLFSACYDAVEISEYAYVTMIGFDQGVTDSFRLTIQIPKFTKGSGESGGSSEGSDQEEKDELHIVEASSMLSAMSIANTHIPFELNFMHTKAIVISEDLAMSGNLDKYIANLIRYRQVRRSTPVIICKGKSEEFIKAARPYLGVLITQSLENLIRQSEKTGFFPNVTLDDMYNSIKSDSVQLLSVYAALNKGENLKDEDEKYEGKYKIPGDYYAGDIPRKEGQEIELLGSTVSNGDIMVGKLTGFETQMVLLVRNELEKVVFTIPDPKSPESVVALEITEFERPKININTQEDKPKIHVKIKFEGDIGDVQSRINYENPELKPILESALEQFIINGMERTFAKCQVFKADVFNFGDVATHNFWTIAEWKSYNWHKKFADAEIKTEVDFIIRRTGTIQKSMPIITSEGIK